MQLAYQAKCVQPLPTIWLGWGVVIKDVSWRCLDPLTNHNPQNALTEVKNRGHLKKITLFQKCRTISLKKLRFLFLHLGCTLQISNFYFCGAVCWVMCTAVVCWACDFFRSKERKSRGFHRDRWGVSLPGDRKRFLTTTPHAVIDSLDDWRPCQIAVNRHVWILPHQQFAVHVQQAHIPIKKTWCNLCFVSCA